MLTEWKRYILSHGHGIKEGCILKKHSKILANIIYLFVAQTAGIQTFKEHLPLIWPYKADHMFQQHTLATPTLTDDHCDLTSLDSKIQAV
jgi:hypothetical protein